MHILRDWFSWPDGSVLTNLVASGICVAFATWKLLRKLNLIHEHVRGSHEHLAAIRQQLETRDRR